MKHYEDVHVEDGRYVSLKKLTGKEIADVYGYIGTPFGGDCTYIMARVVFTDGTYAWCEGEHDTPYLVTYRNMDVPGLDEETLNRLYKEDPDYEGDDDDDGM